RWIGKTRPQIVMMENVREIRGWGPLVAKRCPKTGRVIRLDGTVAAKGERVPLLEQQLVRDKARLGRSYRRFVAHIRQLGSEYDDRDLCCADFGVPTSRRRWFAIARFDGLPIAWPDRTHAPADQATRLGLLPWVGAHTIIDWSVPMPSIFERKRPLAPATERRIAVGLQRYVLDNPRPFIVPVCHSSSPMRVHDGAEPLPTMTTAKGGEFAVVAPALSTFYGEKAAGIARAADVAEPLPTLSTSNRFGLTAAHLTKFRQGSAGVALDQPLPTVTANGHSKRAGCGIPLGVVGATLVQTGYGERPGQAPRALDLEQPIGTQVAGGAKHALVGAWMAQHNFTADRVVGTDLRAPLSTVVAKAGPQAVSAASLVKLRGTSTAQAIEEPVPTLSAGGNHVGCVTAFMTKYYGQGGVTQAADEPLHTLSTKARFGLVTTMIEGQPYVVADIMMRMLEPHEAAAAHELRLPSEIILGGVRQRLTKTDAMRLVGNSVPKRMAMLIAQANHVHALDLVRQQVAAE
ncbi:MAG: hypothetical protein ACRYHQ_26365, partial [Janthinobacterium lividum]